MSEEHYQELIRLRDLSSVPSVQKVLEDMINDRPKARYQDNSLFREPIKRSKAETQTIFITKGYAWSQSPTSILLYIPFENANEVPKESFFLKVLDKSVELNITCPQKGANYNFKINQLYDRVKPDKTSIKCKSDKIIVTLGKVHQGTEWADLRTKTTQTTYNELERYEKKYESTIQDNFETPFYHDKNPDACPKHSSLHCSNNNNGSNKEND